MGGLLAGHFVYIDYTVPMARIERCQGYGYDLYYYFLTCHIVQHESYPFTVFGDIPMEYFEMGLLEYSDQPRPARPHRHSIVISRFSSITGSSFCRTKPLLRIGIRLYLTGLPVRNLLQPAPVTTHTVHKLTVLPNKTRGTEADDVRLGAANFNLRLRRQR